MSDPLGALLLAVRLRSVADDVDLADHLGMQVEDVRVALADAAAAGFVRHHGGPRAGWMLTPAGREAGERRLAIELDASRSRARVVEAYRAFAILNARLLALVTDWQLRRTDGGVVPNDHADPAWDADVERRLAAFDDEAQALCAELADALPRLSSYGSRLARARRRFETGERGWLDRLTVPSYHATWFELHENLLATLGLDRATETAVQAGNAAGPAEGVR